MDPTVVDRYLTEILAPGGLDDLSRVLERRRELLRARGRLDVAEVGTTTARDELERELGAVRDDFWATPREDLETRLAALDLDRTPDLRRWQRRLLRALDLREDVARLAGRRAVPPALVDTLRHVLCASAPEAAALRREYIRGRTGPVWQARHRFALRVLGREVPSIFAVEKRWFDRLRSARRDALHSRVPASYVPLFAGQVRSRPLPHLVAIALVVFVVAFAVAAIVMAVPEP